jgi:hypothetical protein
MPLHIYMELKAKSPETSIPEVDKIPSSNPPSSACACGCAKPHANTLKIRLKSKPDLNLFIITSLPAARQALKKNRRLSPFF